VWRLRAAGVTVEADPEFMKLIEASSLGTPAARALRASTPPEVVDRVRARMRELEREETMPYQPKMPLHLIAETTKGMHPWEALPGTYDNEVLADADELALEAACQYADRHQVEVHVNDAAGNFCYKVEPGDPGTDSHGPFECQGCRAVITDPRVAEEHKQRHGLVFTLATSDRALSATNAARVLTGTGHATYDAADAVLTSIIESGKPFSLGRSASLNGAEQQLAYEGEGLWRVTMVTL
jgi:hypothetical protein